MEYKIIYLNENMTDYEAQERGYRDDVIVEFGNKVYKMYVVDVYRLCQDYEMEKKENGWYQTKANMVLVKEVTKECIYRTIHNLIKTYNFFSYQGFQYS